MNTINSEKFLEEKFKNKRIALIGPADYVNKELPNTHGNFIDNFDIIIRVNSMINIENKELEKYYGKKYDILMSSFWNVDADWKVIDNKEDNVILTRYVLEEEYKKVENGKIFWETNHRSYFINIYNRIKNIFDSKKFIYFNSSYETETKSISFLNKIHPLDRTPTTGLLSIGIILSHEPKELYISGMTVFHNDKYHMYYDGYERTINKSISNKERYEMYIYSNEGIKYKQKENYTEDLQPISDGSHNHKLEKDLFKKLINEKYIKVDQYLEKLVNS